VKVFLLIDNVEVFEDFRNVGVVIADSIEEAAKKLEGTLDSKKKKIWFSPDRFIEVWGGKEFKGFSYHHSHYPKDIKTELEYDGVKLQFGEKKVFLKSGIAPYWSRKGKYVGMGFIIKEIMVLPPG
jgi:hypothetical protein